MDVPPFPPFPAGNPGNYAFSGALLFNDAVQTEQTVSLTGDTKSVVLPNISGDINGDQAVDLADAILALKVLAAFQVEGVVLKAADVNGDGRIGLQEVVFILQSIRAMRD